MLNNTRDLFRPYSDPDEFEKIVELDTVSEMWEGCVRNYADRTAIADSKGEYTYAQLESGAAGFRALINEKTGGQKARVGIFCENSYGFVRAFIAAVTLGCAVAVIPAHLEAEELPDCCKRFNIDVLVYQNDYEDKIFSLKERLDGVSLINVSDSGGAPTPAAKCAAEDECLLMFTGGTNGKNKCALLSNRAVMQGTVNGCYGINPVFFQRYVLVLPFSHVFGIIRNLLTCLYTGSAIYISGKNTNMFREIAAFMPTVMVLVPALAEMALTLSRQFKKNMLGDSVKYIVCGAAAVPPYLAGEYSKMGITLLQGYGLTESANFVAGNPECLKYPDAVGYPYPNQEYKIVDGELWLKGKNIMDGYVGGEGDDPFEDGWLKTGDLVRVDDNGMLYITGRKKKIIVLASGENVSPAELEAKFNALPFVKKSRVFEDVTDYGKHILALEIFPNESELSKIKSENPNGFLIKELERVNRALPAFQRVSQIQLKTAD